MGGYVTVGVTGTTVGVVEQQTQQPARTSGFEGVDVGTQTDAGDHVLQDAAARASSRMVAAFSSSVFSASASSPTRI